MLRIQRIQEALRLSRPGFRTMRPVQAVCSPESNLMMCLLSLDWAGQLLSKRGFGLNNHDPGLDEILRDLSMSNARPAVIHGEGGYIQYWLTINWVFKHIRCLTPLSNGLYIWSCLRLRISVMGERNALCSVDWVFKVGVRERELQLTAPLLKLIWTWLKVDWLVARLPYADWPTRGMAGAASACPEFEADILAQLPDDLEVVTESGKPARTLPDALHVLAFATWVV